MDTSRAQTALRMVKDNKRSQRGEHDWETLRTQFPGRPDQPSLRQSDANKDASLPPAVTGAFDVSLDHFCAIPATFLE